MHPQPTPLRRHLRTGAALSLFALATVPALAQTTVIQTTAPVVNTAPTGTSEFKPVAGMSTLELGFVPFTSSPFGLIDGLRYRLFLSDRTALRLMANLSYSRTSQLTREASDNLPDLRRVNSRTDIVIRPGIERHFEGTRRLSPYIGAEARIGYSTNRARQDFDGPNPGDIEEVRIRNDEGFFSFGVSALAGVDAYIIEHLYVGAEMGVGLGFSSPLETVTTARNGDETRSRQGRTSSISFGPFAQPSIRVGFVF